MIISHKNLLPKGKKQNEVLLQFGLLLVSNSSIYLKYM